MENRYEQLFQEFLAQEIAHHSTPDKLLFLDMGVRDTAPKSDFTQIVPAPSASISPHWQKYPPIGQIPEINEQELAWLHPNITEVCLCVARCYQGEIYTRWYGRSPLVPVQMWSTSKIIPMLALTLRASALAPTTNVENWRIDGYSFAQICDRIVDYKDQERLTSNALAGMLKQFFCPEELQDWLAQITGNQQITFTGLHGEAPFLAQPTLWLNGDHAIPNAPVPHTLGAGQNLISAYDLTRILSLIAWHNYLPIANPHHLAPLLSALTLDCARYLPVALQYVQVPYHAPCTLSKMGFGFSDQRQRYEIAYTGYSRLADDLAICLSLRGYDASALVIDARITTVIIEILDWVYGRTISADNGKKQ
jgi:hypothetical protein